jgi:hypothetical protein
MSGFTAGCFFFLHAIVPKRASMRVKGAGQNASMTDQIELLV